MMGNFKHKPLSPDPMPILQPFKDSDPKETSTLYERTRVDDVAEGAGASAEHHGQRAKAVLVPADDAYPAARQPWDAQTTDAVEHRRQTERREARGLSPADREAAQAESYDYGAASGEALQYRMAWAALIQKQYVEGEAVERAQVIVDACDAELNRRRSAGKG